MDILRDILTVLISVVLVAYAATMVAWFRATQRNKARRQ